MKPRERWHHDKVDVLTVCIVYENTDGMTVSFTSGAKSWLANAKYSLEWVLRHWKQLLLPGNKQPNPAKVSLPAPAQSLPQAAAKAQVHRAEIGQARCNGLWEVVHQ